MMNVEQLERFNIFLKAFHSNDEIEKNYIIQSKNFSILILVYDIINKQIKVNSRHVSMNDVGDLTRVTIDLNKKIADKVVIAIIVVIVCRAITANKKFSDMYEWYY